MRISGKGTTTYLYINGIQVKRPVSLSESVTLLPASCTPDPDAIINMTKSEVDIGVAAIFLRRVSSQLKITAENPKSLAKLAWNTIWDAILLGAFFDCDAVCNFQCDGPAEEFGEDCTFEVTNYHLRGLSEAPYELTEEDHNWVEENMSRARLLLDSPRFLDAVHALASYRWHSHPRARLAIVWSGIEGLFDVQSEIVFRLSLYCAKFLEPGDRDKQVEVLRNVKQLYKHRSAAIHGAKIKGKAAGYVEQSVELLQRLIRSCVESGGLPQVDDLVP